MKGWDRPQDLENDPDSSDKFIYKYIDDYEVHPSTDIKTSYSEPFTELWMFQEYGLENVRGWLLDDGVIQEDLYLYK